MLQNWQPLVWFVAKGANTLWPIDSHLLYAQKKTCFHTTFLLDKVVVESTDLKERLCIIAWNANIPSSNPSLVKPDGSCLMKFGVTFTLSLFEALDKADDSFFFFLYCFISERPLCSIKNTVLHAHCTKHFACSCAFS